MITSILIFLADIEQNLYPIIEQYGAWTYLLFFLLTFLEAGVIFTPFMPGNTLLFVAGTLAAGGALDIWWLALVFILAAIACDSVNYWLGSFLGGRIFQSRYLDFVKGNHVERTRGFYDRYGGRAIVIARFFPYIRTFAPFLAGGVNIPYLRFLRYNSIAGIVWTAFFLLGGYYFGHIPIIRHNIGLLFYAFILLTVVTVIVIVIKLISVMRSPSAYP
jgi:membrane-associated protein